MELSAIQNGIEEGFLKVGINELTEVMGILKLELDFNYLSNLTAVDYQEYFEVVYHLISLEDNTKLEVKVEIEDRTEPSIPTVTNIWRTADWQEREVYDLFGIDFIGHPDLRRILLPDHFTEHPLRKDYQLD